ncbi:DUF4177 domain-containing protein [Clostridium sp.]|uniref:DUF4177 domain-containing protein n=1 Tax=Clostridium sp. TaxID=1506 RepID=UPI003463B421
MYQYKFVRIDLKSFTLKPEEDYHKIIETHAKDGFRLLQIFSPSVGAYGSSSYFELIFEKKISE